MDYHYEDVKNYLNSFDFEKDSNYWTTYILNSSNFVKFYNLGDNNYKSQIINVDNDSISTFIRDHNCSFLDFYGSVFSLYLSRIDRLDGCLLKTFIPSKKSDFGVFDKNTFLKIDVNKNDSFDDLLSEFNSAFGDVFSHSKVDVGNYLDEIVSYYSVYDFTDFNENIQVFTGDDSALTLNIYEDSLELVYNSDLFSDIFVTHLVKNIESSINSILSSPNPTISNIDILSNEEKNLISDFCKGKSIDVEESKVVSEAFREHAIANPDVIAVDDGVNQITYGELEKSSNSIANDLYENHNIGHGSHVALMLPRNYHFIELALALNKIGAAFVPIDLLFPVNRIGHMLDVGEVEDIITTKTIAQDLDLNVNVISIEDLNEDNDVDVDIIAKSDDLFAIMFTSGTTGVPKGVMVSIPLNVNGKVDKRALPDVDRTGLHAEYVAPRNENEKEIVKAFEKALNLENISICDDFIRLGGDSLTAIKLLSYIESDDVTMADIFSFRTPEAIAKNMSDYSFDLDLYSLESGCPLNSAQINVFADVMGYNKRNAYHVQGYIPIPKKYGLEDILDSLDELLNAHPILGMHLSDVYEENDGANIGNMVLLNDLIRTARKFGINKIVNIINAYGLRNMAGLYNMIKTIMRVFKGEYPYLVKGDKPQISVESKMDDEIVIDFLAESLDLYSNLSKFMVVESEESYYLLYVVHHIIFDAISAGVLKHDIYTLLDGGSVDLDDTFLKASAFTHQIKNTEKFEEASQYYDPILSDIGDVGILMEDNSSEGYSMSYYDLEFDKGAFKSFLNNAEISENVFFTGVFAYALSQFVNGDKVLFTLIENGRDRFRENFIGMTSNVMPLVVDCKDQSINSFMGDMADNVYGVLRHSYYPTLLLYQKYNFEVNILFQFVPNWIADDFADIDDIGSSELNQVLNKYKDNLTEFFVQIYQNGENYRLIITNSNKYSDKLINDFKDTFISILSNIIYEDMTSDLSTTLKQFLDGGK